MSNNKGTIKKLVFKALLLFIPLYTLWFLYIQYMPLYYSRPNGVHWYFIRNSLEKKYTVPESSVIFLGESRVNTGIDFAKIKGAYSFASGGATTIEIYYILKKYTEHYGSPDSVFLSVSPRFLSETYAFFPYAVAFKLIDRKDFNEIMSYAQKGDTILAKHPRLKFGLYRFNYFEYYQSDVFYSYVFNSYSKNQKLIKEMMRNKGASPHPGLKDSSSDLNYETKYKSFQPAPLIDVYFNKLLKMCKDSGIYLIFDFMPFNESSLNACNPLFIKEYKTYIQGMERSYPEFSISDTVYSYPDTCFGDESHLNTIGKEKFTNYLLSKYFSKRDTL
jgi:hypothetical protein